MSDSAVSVAIVRATAEVDPSSWQLAYEVRNAGPSSIWLVVDDFLRFRHEGSAIELSYARAKLQPGVQLFGYFDPEVEEVRPGASTQRSVSISWPLRLSETWNEMREVTLPPGEYEVSVRIGFGTTASPEPPQLGEEIEASVLRWQHEVLSAPVVLRIE